MELEEGRATIADNISKLERAEVHAYLVLYIAGREYDIRDEEWFLYRVKKPQEKPRIRLGTTIYETKWKKYQENIQIRTCNVKRVADRWAKY